MADDYKVKLGYNQDTKPDPSRRYIEVNVRASSYEEAARQAKIQNPGYHTTATPVKEEDKAISSGKQTGSGLK